LGRDFGEDRNYSEEIAGRIDSEVRRIIESCYADAKRLLTENWHKVERMVAALLEHETVETDEVIAILNDRPYGRSEETPELPRAAASQADPEPQRIEKPKRLPNISPEPA